MKRKKSALAGLSIALDPLAMGGDPKANLERMVLAARNSVAFGADLAFDDDNWEVRSSTANNRKSTLWFTVHDIEGASRDVESRERLKEPFSAFLKATIRLSEAAAPRSGSSHEAMLGAARYLYDQLRHRQYDPTRVTRHDFEQAERAARERVSSPWSQYAVVVNLVKIASVISRHRLSYAPLEYRPRTPAPDYHHLKATIVHDADGLPSDAALAAIPLISLQVTEPRDVCMMRTIELLHCAPWRIGELLSLPNDCEVVVSPDGQPLTLDCLNEERPLRYGLRYRPEKSPGLQTDIKWIPTAAVPLVRRALTDLRRHSEHGRNVAAYMETNPGRAWLPPDIRDCERLSIDQIAKILESDTREAFRWLRSFDVAIRSDHVHRKELIAGLNTTLSAKASEKALLTAAMELLQRDETKPFLAIAELKDVIAVKDVYRWLRYKKVHVYPFSVARDDVEAVLLRLHRDVSPEFPWKLSECLFVFPHRFFAGQRSLPPSTSLMTRDQLRYFLTGTAQTSSIFERLGFEEPDGSPIHVTSHMFRRWLATLALNEDMSAAHVQNWLGHKSERNVIAYDRRTPEQIARLMRTALMESGIGPLAELARASADAEENESLLEAVLPTAHETDHGLCTRGWAFGPCARYGICAGCEKQMILKGDREHRRAAAETLRENQLLLAHANEQGNGVRRGASNQIRFLETEIATLEATLSIHDDISIADGTYVQLDLPRLQEAKS
ncbi:tyrosine-type recombinase/integrase [Tardiphaga sp. OK245]|uniref:tyrosine-type recombinase/integrase n=1 Tax=Tardiphaga sp. OK245 TaxID=1855306 RepID=UPI0008A767F3|nr:tyrosine-type recombinase/integrase [Tardiphaga sp. OK245]SEH87722.1 hypothetical protein SAMN05216367_2491 [Tardiphaga sp. OK245]